MHNEHSPEQAVAAEIATDATEPPIKFIAKMKAAIAELSAGQILKLILLGSGAHCLVSGLQPIESLLPVGGL